MEAAVGRIVVLPVTRRTEGEGRHGGAIPVKGQVRGQGVARAAVGAADEGVVEAAVGGIEEFPLTKVTEIQIRRGQNRAPAVVAAGQDAEGGGSRGRLGRGWRGAVQAKDVSCGRLFCVDSGAEAVDGGGLTSTTISTPLPELVTAPLSP